jgi:hypothetical protein
MLPETKIIPKAVVRSIPAFRPYEFFIASLMSSIQVGYKLGLNG